MAIKCRPPRSELLDCLNDCNGACCKWLFINAGKMGRDDAEFLKLRGARLMPDGRIALPSPCSMLQADAKCGIYEKRPVACRVFRPGSPDCHASRRLEGYVRPKEPGSERV